MMKRTTLTLPCFALAALAACSEPASDNRSEGTKQFESKPETVVAPITDRGYNLYGLSYDSPDQQDRFSKNQMLQYDMLSDQTSAVIDAFGLRDPQYTDGRAVGVPYASVFVIDKSGKIIAKSVSGDYKKRPSNDQILALVDSI